MTSSLLGAEFFSLHLNIEIKGESHERKITAYSGRNIKERIQEANSLDKLNEVRVAFLGKKGELTAVLKGMKDVAPEDRPKVGQ